MNKKILTSFLMFLVVLTFSTQAQVSSHSPYSRFGLGDINTSYSSYFNALGGGSSAIYSSKHINISNPATYTAFKPNSFIFSTGADFTGVSINNESQSHVDNYTSFSHVLLGCRINDKVFASMGMIPYSSIGYNLTDFNVSNNASLLYSGDGGISKVYLGAGFKLASNLSFGINASYLFGSLNRRKMLEFNDETIFNSRSNSQTNLKGIYYDLGALYTGKIEDDKLTFGFTTSNSAEINAKRSILTETFEYSGVNELVKDTSVNSIEKGFALLPKYTQLGFTYNKDDKWLFVVDYLIQDWSEYSLFGESDSLQNSSRISSGLEYTPEYNSISSFFKRCKYRLGISFNETPLNINNINIEDKSISFGIGVPVKKNNTTYDLSITFGQRGTLSSNLIEEQYVKLSLNVSFDGIWFVERKYD